MVPDHTDFISPQVSESDYFFLDLEPDPAAAFTVTCGGIESCTPEYALRRTRFRYHGIEYIVSGECFLHLHGEDYQLHAGSLFSYSPTTVHRIKNAGKTPLVKAFVDFSGTAIPSVLGDPLPGSPKPVQLRSLSSTHQLFLMMLEAGRAVTGDPQKSIALILRLLAQQVADNALHLEEFQSRSYATFNRCLAFMTANLASLVSMTDLADACHVSTAHLSRLFTRFAGESPSTHLLRLKMNRAGELLLTEPLQVKEIAARLGYPDPYHFSRRFKQVHGIAPDHFRRTTGIGLNRTAEKRGP